MTITRRELLKAGAASGALLLARPYGALAQVLGPAAEFSTPRESRLFPGTWVAHADLHNHTLQSDGDGDPALAFASMRAAGLDVAALTDHATVGVGLPDELATACSECSSLAGIDEAKWQRTKELADEAQEDHSFTAIRGFEWSSPTLGHVNVWFSETWVDPLHTAGATTGEGLGQFMHDEMQYDEYRFPREVSEPLDAFIRSSPGTGLSMEPFYRWLSSPASTPVLGGGSDGIAGFNHPGREVGRFGYFTHKPELRDKLVSCEVFNRREDYIFEGTDSGVQSPINECLNAGWRVGLLGVTDEHGTDWGYPDGKGRTGLWVTTLDRAGVREALEARRFFSTRLRGLRVDAAANGVRMGGSLDHGSGPVTFRLDIDRGEAFWGKALNVQVLMSGTYMPTVVDSIDVTVPAADDPVGVIEFTTDIDVADGNWIVLRISDPSEPADGRATGDWTGFGNAIAYASPFFLNPAS
jgi:hypothetical protein